ncbi:MAG TPA: PspC domain-containing protein [Chloroflexota bacterium]|nr:PspC domain-containing protein [Chloroflexota bacterium]
MDSDPFLPTGRRHRLTRSRRERMWAGVCGGMAEYFDMDPVLVRLFWVVATVLTAGLALCAYFALAFIMPPDERGWDESWSGTSSTDAPTGEGADPTASQYGRGYDYSRRRYTGGILLIGLGIVFLVNQMGLFHWVNWNILWPAILIVIGVALLGRHRL